MHVTPSVLFLCVHNAGRSQMAAGFMRDLAGEKVSVLSAGSAPASSVNPVAVEAMAEVGIDISDATPTSLQDVDTEGIDVVVTMGCGDVCPTAPSTTKLDWALDDPAGQGIGAVREIRDVIAIRVGELAGTLGVLAP